MTVAEDLRAAWPLLSGTCSEPEALADLLYRDWYLGIRPAQPDDGPPSAVQLDPAQALVAAHAAGNRFQPGWRALRVSSAGRVEAGAGEEVRVLEPGEYVCRSHPGRRPRPGDDLAVIGVRTSVEHGCWVARSPRWQGHGVPLTRIYLNVRLAGTPTVVAVLTDELETWGGSYALKVFLDLDRVQRPDALVVYLPRADFHHEVGRRLGGPVATLVGLGLLEPGTPRLAARLATGVAAVDGPADGESFGMGRCRLVASAVTSLSLHRRTEPDVAVAVGAAFAAAGLDITRPHLESAESREYDFAR